MTTKQAVNQLIRELKNDKKFRETWKASIAMSFKESWATHKKKKKSGSAMTAKDIHTISNNAAEDFIKVLCGEIKIPEGR